MLDHLEFIVSDPEKTTELLKHFGYEVIRHTEHQGGAYELTCKEQPTLILEIVRKRPQDKLGMNHPAFLIPGKEEYERIRESISYDPTELHYVSGSGRYVSNIYDENEIKWQMILARTEE